jgi:tetratricopeptide (TPR) repeat protein
MKKSKGGLLSFNNFLSTSKNKVVSMEFACRAASNPDLVGILFVMSINPAKSTTPFASITEISYFKDKEDEVLFSMHTVFRIDDIQAMGEDDRLFRVDLTLTDDNESELRALTDRVREESLGTGWYRLGSLLRTMGQFEKSEQVYQMMLNQTTNESDKASIYNQIGGAKDSQGKYEEAIEYYEKSIEIERKSLPPNLSNLANSYNNIGVVYDEMGEYSKALEYY